MNAQQAKEILLLYRPGTADAEDSDFAQALALTRLDEDLRAWFEAQMTAYERVRRQMKMCVPPEGLREQIVSECPRSSVFNRPVPWRLVTVVVVALVLFAVSASVFTHWRDEVRARRFSTYSELMVRSAQDNYGMDLETNDLVQVRRFLNSRKAPGDFNLPTALEGKIITGCVAASWRQNPVAMICFRSPERPAKSGSDIWLFVADKAAFLDAPSSGHPHLVTVAGVPSAKWVEGDKVYLLASATDLGRFRKMMDFPPE